MLNVTCAIITRNGKFLAAQRSSTDHNALQWEFPGGKIDPGENAQASLVREIREELGVEMALSHRLGSVIHDYGGKIICLIPFIATITAGEPRALEHQQIGWFTHAELEVLDLSAADRKLLRDPAFEQL
ncbi:MAG: NUDIX domain-containing protein [Chitinivibrionales bacterium]|nr:NUDIX domain-containing protein [Chitinivibrionales bacterium]